MELLNHYRRRGLREARNYVPSGSSALERHYIPLHPRSVSHWVTVRTPLAVSALRRSLQVINGLKMKRSVFTRRVASNRRSHREHGVGGKWKSMPVSADNNMASSCKLHFLFFPNVAQILPQEGQDANVAFSCGSQSRSKSREDTLMMRSGITLNPTPETRFWKQSVTRSLLKGCFRD